MLEPHRLWASTGASWHLYICIYTHIYIYIYISLVRGVSSTYTQLSVLSNVWNLRNPCLLLCFFITRNILFLMPKPSQEEEEELPDDKSAALLCEALRKKLSDPLPGVQYVIETVPQLIAALSQAYEQRGKPLQGFTVEELKKGSGQKAFVLPP